MQTTSTAIGKSNHSRTVLLVVFRIEQLHHEPVFFSPLAKIPGTLKDLMITVRGAVSARTPDGGPGPYAGVAPLPHPESFRFFDWALDEMEASVGIVEVPIPGVVFAIFGSLPDEGAVAGHLAIVKANLEKNENVKAFFSSPETRFAPERYVDVDVFVSYSKLDIDLAMELKTELEKSNLRVFLAEKSIGLGVNWEPEIRNALRRSKTLVLLLTPNSVTSPWVIFESGAAWVLNTPIAIATSYVSHANLPAALSSYQRKPYETNAQRTVFTQMLLEMIAKVN